MHATSWIGAILLLAAALPAHAGREVGDYAGLPADLAAAATAYDIAQNRSDRAALERLLADDYTLAGSRGGLQSKAEFIADATAPGSRMDSVALDIQVRKVWRDGAALGGTADVAGTERGTPFQVRLRFIDVWAKRDGRWQVIFTQAERIADRSAALPAVSDTPSDPRR